MRLDRITAKPGSQVTLAYIFKDDVGQPISSDTPVSVSIFARSGSLVEAGLEASGGPKYSLEYEVPRERPIDSYLVEFIGSYAGSQISGYIGLDIVLVTDADFAELSEKTESSVTYDGTNVTFAAPTERLKALQSLTPPTVGYITKNRSRRTSLGEDSRDYDRGWRK